MKAEKEGIEDINVRGELVEAYLRESSSPKVYWLSTDDKDYNGMKLDTVENLYCVPGVLDITVKCKKAPGCPVEYVNLDGLRVLYTRLMKDDMSLLNSWLDGPKENYVNIEKMDGTCKTYSNRLWNCGHSGFYYWRNPLGNVENGIRPNAVRLASQLYPEKHDSDIKFLAALGREIDDLVYYQEKFSNPGLLRETLRPNKVDLSGDIK